MSPVKQSVTPATPIKSLAKSAASDHTSHYRAIGISAVAASALMRRDRPAAPAAPRDIPAILRNGFDD